MVHEISKTVPLSRKPSIDLDPFSPDFETPLLPFIDLIYKDLYKISLRNPTMENYEKLWKKYGNTMEKTVENDGTTMENCLNSGHLWTFPRCDQVLRPCHTNPAR